MAVLVTIPDPENENEFFWLGMDDHEYIILMAEEMGHQVIMHMYDHFEDAEFSPNELEPLKTELKALSKRVEGSAKQAIEKFIDLCDHQIDKKGIIQVICE